MATSTSPKRSKLGIVGIFMITACFIGGFVADEPLIAIFGIAVGVIFCILALFLERLDTIIDLLRQIVGEEEIDSLGRSKSE